MEGFFVTTMMVRNIKEVRSVSNYTYIGRGTIFGNPYHLHSERNRDKVIADYEKYVLNCPKVLKAISELPDKDLVCHCKPRKCHGDVILDIRNRMLAGELLLNVPMKLAIVGSRTYTNYEMFKKYLHLALDRLGWKYDIIISGGARGVDSLAKRYWEEEKKPFIELLADWDNLGNGAGNIRNTEVVMQCTHMLAFWDYRSQGTADAIQKAYQFNKEIHKIDLRRLV